MFPNERDDVFVLEDGATMVTVMVRMPTELLSSLIMDIFQDCFRTIREQPYLQEVIESSFIDCFDGFLVDVTQSHLRNMTYSNTATGIDFSIRTNENGLKQRLARIPLPGVTETYLHVS